jgi:predicted esterase
LRGPSKRAFETKLIQAADNIRLPTSPSVPEPGDHESIVKTRRHLHLCFLVLGLCHSLRCGGEEAVRTLARKLSDRQFTNSAPYSSDAEILRHFGYAVPVPDYNIKQERFRTIIPETYSTNEAWGLLVWISAENEAHVPDDIAAEAGSHRVLVVSPYQSGNNRHPLDRFRLALDAVCGMCRDYHVDRGRIYVSGFSGGSRMASMLGVAYGDLFSGTLCICGVNFYRAVRSPEGEEFPVTYVPQPGPLARAKQLGRFVMITGETDPNRRSTRLLVEKGFKQESFRNITLQDVPRMGHAVPGRKEIQQAFDFLADRAGPKEEP